MAVGGEGALVEAIKESLDEEHDPERLRERPMDFSAEKAVGNYSAAIFPNREQ